MQRNQPKSPFLASILLFLTAVIWGWTFVATKICLNYISPLEVMSMRFLIGVPVLGAIVLAKKARLSVGNHRGRLLVGAILLTCHFIIQVTGLKYTTATNTAWIIAVTPLVMAVLAYLILKEKISRSAAVGIFLATAGILILVSKGHITELRWLSSIGDWLILASAHTWALYTIATRDVARNADPLAVTFLVLLPSAVIIPGYVFIMEDWSKYLTLPPEPVLALLYLALFGTAIGHWFWQEGVARIGAAQAGIFLYIEPVATTAMAVPYLHESFGPATAIGAALVLAGVTLGQYRLRPVIAQLQIKNGQSHPEL